FNQWLMTQENTIDINDMVRDPSDKTRLASAFDSGDHLHFSQTGGEILGKAVAEKILYLSLL
ncbi:g-d-s-l family lipolytic protein, partial [Listeria monocytogenes]|nr:g-d-s-l family lipolytic protein [Listeria monocytogenes]